MIRMSYFSINRSALLSKYISTCCILFSDDNIPSNLENNKGVVTKQNGKTVRFQTETEEPSNNDSDPKYERKDKKETNR